MNEVARAAGYAALQDFWRNERTSVRTVIRALVEHTERGEVWHAVLARHMERAIECGDWHAYSALHTFDALRQRAGLTPAEALAVCEEATP